MRGSRVSLPGRLLQAEFLAVLVARDQHPLSGEDSQPQRHQVTGLPPVQPVVTAYQVHSLVCPACGATTRADLPIGAPRGAYA